MSVGQGSRQSLLLEDGSSTFRSASQTDLTEFEDPIGLAFVESGLEVLESEPVVLCQLASATTLSAATENGGSSGNGACADVMDATVQLSSSTVVERQPGDAVAVIASAADGASCAGLAPSTSGASTDDVNQFIEEFLQQYKEQLYLVQACNALRAFCQHTGTPQATLESALAQQGVCLSDLMQQAANLEDGLKEIDNDDGWQLIQDSELRLLYRHEPGSRVYGFKAACTLPSPTEHPLAMAREFDLISTWNRYMTDTSILKVVAIADMLVYAALWMPWPFSQRDAVMHAVGVDLMRERGCLAISIGSPDKLPDGVELPPEAESRQRITIMPNSCLTLTPLQPEAAGQSQRTRADVVAYVDAKMPSVPEPIIQFVLRVFAPFVHSIVLSVLRKNFRKPEDPLPARMQQRMGPTQLYGLIRDRVVTFLAGANAAAI